jgi:uncharacterized protein YbbC (DUF1343 family)
VLTGVALLSCCYNADPARFAWRLPPYEYEHDKMPIDILAGQATLRHQIESGVEPTAIAESWKPGVAEFNRIRAEYLLY